MFNVLQASKKATKGKKWGGGEGVEGELRFRR